VIDYVVANPPADIGIVRLRPFDKLRRIVVPVAGGPNGRLAVTLAAALARNTIEPTEVIMLNVISADADRKVAEMRAETAFRQALNGDDLPFVRKETVTAESPLAGILAAAENSDMVIIGATREPLFRNLLMGNVSQQVVEQTKVPVIVVKQRSNLLAAVLRETVLPPVH
jgi:nucleotide-binding universal stress UspA family protein